MTGIMIYWIIVVASIFILLCYRIKIYRTNCMWYWDDIDGCWRTQCRPRSKFIGYCESDAWRFREKDCLFCDKPISVNSFKKRSQGKP